MKICESNLAVVYKAGHPSGIRDRTGFLFFFREVTKRSGQGERYEKEKEQLQLLADFLLKSLEGTL